MKQLKPRDKITQKMTRDGAVAVSYTHLATDVFVSLISQKYGKINTKEYLAKKKDMGYNEDEVQKSQIPSGLCG